MSKASIRKQIKKYEELKSESEERLSRFEKDLEHLLDFRSRYDLGITEFNENLNHRKDRANSVKEMSEHVKCGITYFEGMTDDLTGEKNAKVMQVIEYISQRIESVRQSLEDKIETEKERIKSYSETIDNLYRRLSKEDD